MSSGCAGLFAFMKSAFAKAAPAGSKLKRISPASGLARETFAHQDFQQRLIANAFAVSDLASLCEIGFS
jgi:hypothetical protein